MDSDVKHALLHRYVLFSVEGAAEGIIIEQLYESGLLLVPKERVVSDAQYIDRPYTRTRKAADIAREYLGVNYEVDGSEGLLIARIVDSRSSSFILPRNVRRAAKVESFFTRPEIEMLVIHREDAYDDWLRESRRDRQLKPSEFCKGTLGFDRVKETAFLRSYWSDSAALVQSIRKYARYCQRRKGEYVLADLLK